MGLSGTGVAIQSFHTKSASLPDLGGNTWSRLLGAHQRPAAPSAKATCATSDAAAQQGGNYDGSGSTFGNSSAVEGAAAFVLAEPHFSHVRRFETRDQQCEETGLAAVACRRRQQTAWQEM